MVTLTRNDLYTLNFHTTRSKHRQLEFHRYRCALPVFQINLLRNVSTCSHSKSNFELSTLTSRKIRDFPLNTRTILKKAGLTSCLFQLYILCVWRAGNFHYQRSGGEVLWIVCSKIQTQMGFVLAIRAVEWPQDERLFDVISNAKLHQRELTIRWKEYNRVSLLEILHLHAVVEWCVI